MQTLTCYHCNDGTKLKIEINEKSGEKLRCPKCHCLFGVVTVTNDTKCLAIRNKLAPKSKQVKKK